MNNNYTCITIIIRVMHFDVSVLDYITLKQVFMNYLTQRIITLHYLDDIKQFELYL